LNYIDLLISFMPPKAVAPKPNNVRPLDGEEQPSKIPRTEELFSSQQPPPVPSKELKPDADHTRDIFQQNSVCNIQSPKRPAPPGTSNTSVPNLPKPISERLIDHGFSHGVGDHVLGLLILKSTADHSLSGTIVVGGVGIPGLSLCKANQVTKEGNKLYKMSFASKALVDYFVANSFIPKKYLDLGFFNLSGGYAIAAASTLSIPRCADYYSQLHVEPEKLNDLFPLGGARINPQPKSAAEEQSRRQELQNSIEWLKSFDDLSYHVLSKDGRDLTFKVRLEIEELEVGDNELLERLLCFRVLESIPPQPSPAVSGGGAV
jgi:hypothetical protein